MTWDFGQDFYLLGAWVSDHLLIELWVCALIICLVLALSDLSKPGEQPHLSQGQMDNLDIYNSHGALPPQFFLAKYKGEDVEFLAECVDTLSAYKTKETGEL